MPEEDLDQIDRQLGRVLLVCNIAGSILGLYVIWDLVKDTTEVAEMRAKVKNWWMNSVGQKLSHREWLKKEEAHTVFEAMRIVDSDGNDVATDHNGNSIDPFTFGGSGE